MSSGLASGVLGAASAISVGYYLFIWGLVSLALLLVTFKIGVKAITIVFITLTLTFFLNAAANFGMGIGPLAGYMTLLLGISALYTSLALVANSVFGKTVAPL